MQSIIHAVYPPQCVACSAPTEFEYGLCGACWVGIRFVQGAACDTCGLPVPGEVDNGLIQCDDCMRIARPWSKGRAAIVYEGLGRQMVLGLKHGDRNDYVPAMANWLVSAGSEILDDTSVLIPVPLHRFRLFRRKFNQAAELVKAVATIAGHDFILDGLLRNKQTKTLDHATKDQRFAALDSAISPNPKVNLEGRNVVLVDDVMTSGATLAACADACRQMRSQTVSCLVLARAVKDT